MTTSLRPRLSLEPLDRRDVPATLTLSGGVLTIEGTSSAEYVSVSSVTATWNTKVRVTTPPHDGLLGTIFEQQYAPGTVQKVVFNGGHGDDSFTCSTSIPCTVDGGYGNDTITGGAGNDTITGGPDQPFVSDNDVIHGGGGSDTIHGGAGQDRIYGDGGNDWLYGDVGHDTLYGGAGSDHLYGGYGNDYLCGSDWPDDDTTDWLYGGQGADHFDYWSCSSHPDYWDFDANYDTNLDGCAPE